MRDAQIAHRGASQSTHKRRNMVGNHQKLPRLIGCKPSNGPHDNESHIIVLRSTRNKCVR
jgi:hypothetical protein